MIAPNPRRWAVVADFFQGLDSNWLDDFILDDQLTFEKVPPIFTSAPAQGWHFQRGRTTSFRRWGDHLSQIRRAFDSKPDGMITVFPQLAMVAGMMKRLRRSQLPIIAYTYNLGGLPGGLRQRLARFAAQAVNAFVVHSPTEVAPYAAYLRVPHDRIVFMPLQRGAIDVKRSEQTEDPFILAMGSAHRDYPTLIAAVDRLRIPTVIITRPADIADLPKSDWVSYRTHLTPQECHALLARARLSVTPVANLNTASGQITFIDAMRLGVPVIATRCPGSDGYITDGKTGRLVAPFDVQDMASAIGALWQNENARTALSLAAFHDAQTRFTDTAAAAQLQALIHKMS